MWRAHKNGRLEWECVTPIEAHSLGVLKIEHWSRACLATLTFYAACTVHVTIFSTGGKFRPVSIFTQLHALTLVTRSWDVHCNILWRGIMQIHVHQLDTAIIYSCLGSDSYISVTSLNQATMSRKLPWCVCVNADVQLFNTSCKLPLLMRTSCGTLLCCVIQYSRRISASIYWCMTVYRVN